MSTIIGVCHIELVIHGANSLKHKRQVIKSITARLRQKYNVSVAEVGHLDSWQNALIGVVSVSNDRDYIHGLMMKVARWIEETRLDCELVDYQIDLL